MYFEYRQGERIIKRVGVIMDMNKTTLDGIQFVEVLFPDKIRKYSVGKIKELYKYGIGRQ
ncbi:hypothetical protein D3C76_1871250 [compost metagenome]